MRTIVVFDMDSGKEYFREPFPRDIYEIDAWRFVFSLCPEHKVPYDLVTWEFIDDEEENNN